MRRVTSSQGVASRFRVASRACFAAFLLILAAAALSPPVAQATFPGANGQIAFQTNRDGNDEIYTMNYDGSDQTNRTSNAASDRSPSWSPDGKKIAFATDRDGNFEIYTMNADGSGLTRVTNNAGSDTDPSWSADQTQLAFVTNRDGNNEIYTVNANGTGLHRLTNNVASDTEPTWSPDGAKIAITTDRDGNNEIYEANPDGTGLSRITNSSASDSQPAWPSDNTGCSGTNVDFRKAPLAGNVEIFGLEFSNCTATRQITSDSCNNFYPAPSPDNADMAYSADCSGNEEIYLLSGSPGPVNLTNNAAQDTAPDWQSTYELAYSAPNIQVPLVPAFRQCGTSGNPANRTHAPPLTSPSCTPPVPTASRARFGIRANNLVNLVSINVPGDEKIDVTLNDIRTGTQTGPDYTPNASGPDVTLVTRWRLTDTQNGPSQTESATAVDLDFAVPINCAATADPKIGASCSVGTFANAVLPGAIRRRKDMSVQVFRIRINDAGPDGIAGNGDDTLFAQQGVFNP